MALRPRLSLVRSPNGWDLRAVADVNEFGFLRYLTASLPDRLYAGLDDAERPASVNYDEADVDVEHILTPLEYLLTASSEQAWPAETKRALWRLHAMWLLIEDRYRLLDAEAIDTLAHQASLVEHIASSPDLTRVLIADEVGLGKTVEAGLLVRRLQEATDGSLRVLYLTEARLVQGVAEEFVKLGLRPREWSTARQEARLAPGDSDPLVIASINKAVLNREVVASSGPWDILIVDEAHHLTDWSPDGSDPQQRMRLCRELIAARLSPNGRVFLLTGTPHQGSEERFNNLLRLLSRDGDRAAARGKVIYRIKDDIVGWDGKPLFPRRQVNEPTQIDGGAKYSEWLGLVHQLLTPPSGDRAAAWRRAQALQWCASSPQAGVAYLARLALRSGYSTRSQPILAEALRALRPYRGGSPNETIADLEARLVKGRTSIEDDADDVFQESELPEVLEIGVDLIRRDVVKRKIEHLTQWLHASNEKMVVFAQPIETVYVLKSRLEREFGPGSVSLIVGEQTPPEREEQISAFWNRPGCRALVSSRAGGEGINLQVARHLVHFDVPWNPMEMEQRVGRVHRYGSVETIIVDTLVLRDSREQRVLNRSRARLARITRDLDQNRFELLFSRTMALIPLDELATLMAGEHFGDLTRAEEDRIDRLVTAGYAAWKERDAEFRDRTEHLRSVNSGKATNDDLTEFLTGGAGAKQMDGWHFQFLEEDGATGQTRSVSEPAVVLQLPSSDLGYIGPRKGVSITGPTGDEPRRLGLNDRAVASAFRDVVGGALPNARAERALIRGAGLTLIDAAAWMRLVNDLPSRDAFQQGALLLAYAVRNIEAEARMREVGTELHSMLQAPDGGVEQTLSADALATLLRSLRTPRPKRSKPSALNSEALLHQEALRISAMQTRKRGEPLRAVFPIAAIWIEPTEDAVGAVASA